MWYVKCLNQITNRTTVLVPLLLRTLKFTFYNFQNKLLKMLLQLGIRHITLFYVMNN